MRIITGKYKGRRFDVPRTFKARPTTDFAKENIFNVLQGMTDLEGCMALDLFAGTGSITLEMLSRECRHVVSVEADREHAAFIRQCLQKLGADNCTLVRGDVFRFLKTCRQQFDFIFADPPYALQRLPELPDIILTNQEAQQSGAGEDADEAPTMLAKGGIFVFEHGKQYDFSSHPYFIDHRAYGSVNFSIFRR